MTAIAAAALLKSKWIEAGIAAAGLLALVASYTYQQRTIGHDQAIAQINEAAAPLADAAAKARAAVPDSGNALWLRQHSCRDCRAVLSLRGPH
jgi:hypothetical protein